MKEETVQRIFKTNWKGATLYTDGGTSTRAELPPQDKEAQIVQSATVASFT
jgi:hypothetical protein